MRLRNIIILLLILPVLVWGGVKAFLWYSIDATFKQAQDQLSNRADISYREVRTSVLGPIGLTGITIRPKGSDDVIKVGALLATWNEPKGKDSVVSFGSLIRRFRVPYRSRRLSCCSDSTTRDWPN